MTKIFYYSLIVIIFGTIGCADLDEKESKEKVKSMGEELAASFNEPDLIKHEKQKSADSLDQNNNPGTANYQELKSLLPHSVGEFHQKEISAEQSSIFRINVTKAQASYENSHGSLLKMKLIDMGKLKGLTTFTALTWTMVDFERQKDQGYERTLTYAGYKAFEEYNNENKSGRIQLIVTNRFLIEVEGYGVEMSLIKKALNKIDFDLLESLKVETVVD